VNLPQCLRLALARRKCTLPLQSRLLREPLPSRGARLADIEVIVLAFETSGAELARDHILAAGWVLVRGGRIVLASARELRLRDDGHGDGITGAPSESDLEDAESTEAVVRYLLSELAGRAIAAHDAAIEQAFLDAELRRIGGVPMPNPFVSTKAVERRIAADWGIQLREQDGELLLDSCRARHGLPERSRRSAGADAVACAELLLAQIGRMGGPDRVKLRQLM
jgi:DNA polymerase III subunit epsilon